jgi:hypothetical protein
MALTLTDMTDDEQDELLYRLALYSADPLGFVMWAYPWGEKGSELESYDGPEEWQRELLTSLGNGVVSTREAIALAQGHEAETDPIQEATTSGHGIGKSACVSWIMDWAQSTMEDMKGIVTANTENQLKTKTWAEFAKWHRMSLAAPLFKFTATARFSVDPDHEKTWRIDAIAWSEKNPQAFAGLHNKGKRILIVFDEASEIVDVIWETIEGALTDNNTEIIWVVFGNPNKSIGRFRECFKGGKFAHRWGSRAVDSRTVSITNKSKIAKWVEDYGLDHDFVRVRVLGTFPRVDASSFISLTLAQEAVARPLPEHNPFPVVLGVDCARMGADKSVIYPRQGRDARSRAPRVFQKIRSTELATQVFNAYVEYNAVAVFVDGGAMGGAIIDMLLDMGVPVYEVTFGGRADAVNPDDPNDKYLNKRAEIWGSMKAWLPKGCIRDEIPMVEQKLSTELATPTYGYAREDFIQLQPKKEIKPSPDTSDALACTFAYPSAIPQVIDRHANSNATDSYKDHNPLDQLAKEYA